MCGYGKGVRVCEEMRAFLSLQNICPWLNLSSLVDSLLNSGVLNHNYPKLKD